MVVVVVETRNHTVVVHQGVHMLEGVHLFLCDMDQNTYANL